jgi:hypothetical protein
MKNFTAILLATFFSSTTFAALSPYYKSSSSGNLDSQCVVYDSESTKYDLSFCRISEYKKTGDVLDVSTHCELKPPRFRQGYRPARNAAAMITINDSEEIKIPYLYDYFYGEMNPSDAIKVKCDAKDMNVKLKFLISGMIFRNDGPGFNVDFAEDIRK